MSQQPFKVFDVTDIHGSEICWRKFLNAGTCYQADVVVVGGDITGKATVPIIRRREQPVGSTSVQAAIERVQPLLGLHGHIHMGGEFYGD
jgi:Icc-related predicted phosphoesterase